MFKLIGTLSSLIIFFTYSQFLSAKELVVYSSRTAHLIDPAFKEYTKKTGINIITYQGKAGSLIQKLKSEGKSTKADILLTVDGGNLWNAANLGLFQPVNSKILMKNIPGELRDLKNLWFGLSLRARTIAYNSSKINVKDLTSYEDLALPKWKKKLCLRTSKKVYNQSLVAMLIHIHGVKKAEKIVKGWVQNLAADIFSNDTKVLNAIDSEQCQVGIVNSYYFGRLKKKNPKLKVALFWPNQKSTGVHVNVSGAGVLKHSKNKAEAIKLLEWLSSAEAQNLFSDVNMEYPVNPNIKPDKIVASWGSFKSNNMNISKTGELQAEAIKLMDRVKYK